jgi:hypothetical protein
VASIACATPNPVAWPVGAATGDVAMPTDKADSHQKERHVVSREKAKGATLLATMAPILVLATSL